MGQETRKATDVLLDLENKIDTLLGIVRSQDLNIKVLSNKLSDAMVRLDKLQTVVAPKATIEVVQTPNNIAAVFGQVPVTDPERTVVVSAESKLPMDDGPQGFRRISRPETFSGDDSYIKKNGVPSPRSSFPIPATAAQAMAKPPPGRTENDIPVIQRPKEPKVEAPKPSPERSVPPPTQKIAQPIDPTGIVPIEQRVVDRNGRSVFLADVEIVDLSSGEQVSKSRTNATGKWVAALPLGEYRVAIRKLESLTREKVEAVQSFKVDGTESPLKLQMIIIK